MSQLHVFLLEDSPTDVALVKFQAEKLGLIVVHTENIAEIDLAEGCQLAILDLCVVGSDGCETVARFRRQFPVMPLLVHSGTDAEFQCREEGADYFVSKGSGTAELVSAMKTAVKERKHKLHQRASSLPKGQLEDLILAELDSTHDDLQVLAEEVPKIC
ncbi:MAG TPA: hypothetical protein DCE55_29365 [Planctomycetaceae bacterium]|nr:hypothetical protein [Planctomycetaceae bacterium]|tara:strand:- start:5682 stop:6158 length:477 start_codon:yes stop_codon:yes gene_type:complete